MGRWAEIEERWIEDVGRWQETMGRWVEVEGRWIEVAGRWAEAAGSGWGHPWRPASTTRDWWGLGGLWLPCPS